VALPSISEAGHVLGMDLGDRTDRYYKYMRISYIDF